MIKCPYCESSNLYFDAFMNNYYCYNCNKIIEKEDIESEN